jgi:hypothetical protein
MLADILEGLPSRPHESSYLVAKGHKQYEYYARALTQFSKENTGKIEYMAEANVDNGKEFDTLIENLDITMNCIGTSSKPIPILAEAQEGTDWQ